MQVPSLSDTDSSWSGTQNTVSMGNLEAKADPWVQDATVDPSITKLPPLTISGSSMGRYFQRLCS